MRASQEIEQKHEAHDCVEMHALDKNDLPPYSHLLSYKVILKRQQEDKALLNTTRYNVHYVIKDFTAASCTHELICLNRK